VVVRDWLYERSLTLVMLSLFTVFTVRQTATVLSERNAELAVHGQSPIGLPAYLVDGHLLESLFEEWESEFCRWRRS
jgi:uncharacterized protein DUF6766